MRYFSIAKNCKRTKEAYGDRVLDIPNEEFVRDTTKHLRQICGDFLDITCSEDYPRDCSSIVDLVPSVTRNVLVWNSCDLTPLKIEPNGVLVLHCRKALKIWIVFSKPHILTSFLLFKVLRNRNSKSSSKDVDTLRLPWTWKTRIDKNIYKTIYGSAQHLYLWTPWMMMVKI